MSAKDDLKKCPSCKVSFPNTIDFFYNQGTRNDGIPTLQHKCKNCSGTIIRKDKKIFIDRENRSCARCDETYPRTVEFFYKNKKAWDGLDCYCKKCKKEINGKWDKKNPIRKIEMAKKANLKRRITKPKEVRAEIKKWSKNEYNNNPAFRIRMVLSQRLYKALKGKLKEETTMSLLGCTTGECVLWIESQFKNDMNWLNYGKGEEKWNIDHIKPCASFDLTQKIQREECFHYTNLQPLWEKENILKNASIGGKWYSNGKIVKNWNYVS